MNSLISKMCFGSATAFLVLQFQVAGQIPNGGFENWTGCLPDEWATPNVCGELTPITRVSAAHTGMWAARGEVISFFGQSIQPVLQSGATGEGTPISQRHAALQGSYRFSPLGGDRFGVNVAFFHGGAVVAQGAIANPATAGTYTPFTVTMNYVSAEIPDTAIIEIQIIGPVTGADFHTGSVMHVDSLEFTTSSVAPPILSIQRNGSLLLLHWPLNVTGYRLQSNPTLNPVTWSDVSGVVNNSYQTAPGTQVFFRLLEN